MSNNKQNITVRPRKAIIIHWFNAFCWMLLTISGLGIVRGDMRFMPQGFAEWLQNLVYGQFNLIVGHSVLGIIWTVVLLLFTLANWREVIWPFLQKVLTLTPATIIADSKFMVITIANLFGRLKHISLPPANRYNGAQRLLGTMIIASSLIIIATGITMFFLFIFTQLMVDGVIFRW
jgi:formate dehydrogenase subunit gamma